MHQTGPPQQDDTRLASFFHLAKVQPRTTRIRLVSSRLDSYCDIVYRMRSRDISPDSGLRNQFRRKVVLLLLLRLLPSLLSSCFSRVFGVFGPLFPFLIIPFPLFLSYLSRRRPFYLVVFKSIEVIEVNSQNRIRDSSGKKE